MLVMFVGNMTTKAQATNLSQNKGYEIVTFGGLTNEISGTEYFDTTTNVIWAVGQKTLISRNAQTGVVTKTVLNLNDPSAIAGSYQRKHLTRDGSSLYLIDEFGSAYFIFKAHTSFPREGADLRMANLWADQSKVCVYGNFDSIEGKTNTPKFALIYDMVTGSITPLFPPEQEWSIEKIVPFKNKLFFGVNSTKEGRIDKSVLCYDLITKVLSYPVVNKSLFFNDLATDGNTLLLNCFSGYYDYTLYKYNEVTGNFEEKFIGVSNACFFKGKCYLASSDIIKKCGTNEEIQANYFVEYNTVNDELIGLNAIADASLFDVGKMAATKDYLVFYGTQGRRLQAKANGINGYKNASALNIPNPMPSTYSLQVPNDYVGSVLTVTDLKGSVLMERKLDGDVVEFNFPAGAYVLQIRNEKTYTIKKIIVR